MSEPKTKADRIHLLTPWLYHWTVPDDRIDDFRSDAYAVLTGEGKVLVDPLPLAEEVLAEMGKVVAICLTRGHHQRSAWRYRQTWAVPVYAPAGPVEALEEEPDQWYHDGDVLPGGLKAIATPGVNNNFALLMETEGGSGALFCGDLLVKAGEGPISLLPDAYLDDPAAARESAGKLAELQVEMLCPAHGEPCLAGCAGAIRGAVEGDVVK